MEAHDELLSAAVDITRAASGLAAQRFLEGVPVSKKPDGTEVTPADIEVEELMMIWTDLGRSDACWFIWPPH